MSCLLLLTICTVLFISRPSLGQDDGCCGCTTEGDVGVVCTDPVCEASVCAIDPFCCSVFWDVLCAYLALTNPDCCTACPAAPPGTCCGCTASGACGDTDCLAEPEIEALCLTSSIPICCDPPDPVNQDGLWEGECAAEATIICEATKTTTTVVPTTTVPVTTTTIAETTTTSIVETTTTIVKPTTAAPTDALGSDSDSDDDDDGDDGDDGEDGDDGDDDDSSEDSALVLSNKRQDGHLDVKNENGKHGQIIYRMEVDRLTTFSLYAMLFVFVMVNVSVYCCLNQKKR